MMPVEKNSITRSDKKKVLNRYSMISLSSRTYDEINWNPPKNRANRTAQKMALQIKIMLNRSRESSIWERRVFLSSRQRRTRNARATWLAVTGGAARATGDRPGSDP